MYMKLHARKFLLSEKFSAIDSHGITTSYNTQMESFIY